MKSCTRQIIRSFPTQADPVWGSCYGQIRIQQVCHPRRGAVMVFALIALLVASLMIGSLMRTASKSHRQLKRDEYRLQANFLADAGVQRALRLLQQDPEFQTGEWNISSEQLVPGRSAHVQMTVTTDPDNPAERIVSAVARYPMEQSDFVRITRQIHISK
jgi:hypothetical protein